MSSTASASVARSDRADSTVSGPDRLASPSPVSSQSPPQSARYLRDDRCYLGSPRLRPSASDDFAAATLNSFASHRCPVHQRERPHRRVQCQRSSHPSISRRNSWNLAHRRLDDLCDSVELLWLFGSSPSGLSPRLSERHCRLPRPHCSGRQGRQLLRQFPLLTRSRLEYRLQLIRVLSAGRLLASGYRRPFRQPRRPPAGLADSFRLSRQFQL